MTSDLDTNEESPTEARRRRAFQRQIWTGSAIFVLSFSALSAWGPRAGSWRWALVGLPLLAFLWMVIAVARRVRTMDEYQVSLLLRGIAVGFLVAMLAAITLGVLDSAGFAVPQGGWLISIAGLLAWQVANLFTGAPGA